MCCDNETTIVEILTASLPSIMKEAELYCEINNGKMIYIREIINFTIKMRN